MVGEHGDAQVPESGSAVDVRSECDAALPNLGASTAGSALTRVQSPPAPPAQDQPQAGCQFFTAPVTVDGGGQQQAVGKTCQQPDGSLQVTLQAPGLPLQTYTMPPPQSVAPDQQQPQPQTTTLIRIRIPTPTHPPMPMRHRIIGRTHGPLAVFPSSPAARSFSSGTVFSSGIDLAACMQDSSLATAFTAVASMAEAFMAAGVVIADGAARTPRRKRRGRDTGEDGAQACSSR